MFDKKYRHYFKCVAELEGEQIPRDKNKRRKKKFKLKVKVAILLS